MATDEEVLSRLEDAFVAVERPEHFTNYRHCSECFEHDETLLARDWATLTFDDIGSQAWNPITFCEPPAFTYWLPALGRFALAPPDAKWGWYGEQLVFQLRWDGPRNARWQACIAAQRAAVVALLEHIVETRSGLVKDYDCENELLDALTIWSERD